MVEFGFAPMHNAVGAILGGRGNYEGAAEAFSKAIAEDPGNISAHYNLGLALAELRQFDEAARAFERAVELYPGYGEAREALARVRERASRRQEAESPGERRNP
jgi:tetratricopeptide (TPR) repeat protein